MELDLNTLLLVTVYVEAMLGLLLLFAWVQNTQIKAVAWWGFAHILRSASIVLFGMYGTVSDAITIDLANSVLFTAFAMTYTGARVFDGRKVQPTALVAGAILWVLISRTSFVLDSIDARVLISSAVITCYTWATAYEFWRWRTGERGTRDSRESRTSGHLITCHLTSSLQRRAVPCHDRQEDQASRGSDANSHRRDTSGF